MDSIVPVRGKEEEEAKKKKIHLDPCLNEQAKVLVQACLKVCILSILSVKNQGNHENKGS